MHSTSGEIKGVAPRRALIGKLRCQHCTVKNPNHNEDCGRNWNEMHTKCPNCMDIVLCHNTRLSLKDNKKSSQTKAYNLNSVDKTLIEILLMSSKSSKGTKTLIHQKRHKVGYLLAEITNESKIICPKRARLKKQKFKDYSTAKQNIQSHTQPTNLHRCALMGLRITESCRNQGLAKKLIAVWLLICKKLELAPHTKCIEKPVICLTLQRLGTHETYPMIDL